MGMADDQNLTLARALMGLHDSIPENKEHDLSLANMLRGGLRNAAGWMDWQNRTTPDAYSPQEVMAPLGFGLVGSAPVGALAANTPRRTLYHGTPRRWEGDQFDYRKSGLNEPAAGYVDGMHLAPNEKKAGGYAGWLGDATVYSFEDLTKKPFKWDRTNQPETTKRVKEIFPEFSGPDIVMPDQIRAWTEALKRHGYDSVEVYDHGKLTEIGVINPATDLQKYEPK